MASPTLSAVAAMADGTGLAYAVGNEVDDQQQQDASSPSWSADQLNVIILFERFGAALSVTGVLLIFVAFAVFKRLRTVPNTFIVFASFANLGASIACLIGYSGVLAGSTSHVCQAQAFMFELFMQSDPWWSFAMAVNVYMVFFFSANPKSFLRYWWAYFCVCYGIPLIPALWLLVVRGSDGQNVYGNATIWCWIDGDWSDLRIYTYYLPIWVCIILSTCIYIAVGYHVFQRRNRLRNLSLSNPDRHQNTARDSGEKNLFTNAAVMGTVNREVVQVTTVNSTVEHHAKLDPASPSSPSGRSATNVNWFDGPLEELSPIGSSSTARPTTSGGSATITPTMQYHHHHHHHSHPRPYQTTVTRITADPPAPAPRRPFPWCLVPRVRLFGGMRAKLNHMDPVKLAYLRTSFVFAISVLVTWTPSSINRVHDLVATAGEASFGLNLASSVVLPLQGVWNAVIFFSTSWRTLREEARARRDRRRGLPRGQRTADAVRCERERAVRLERRIATGAGGKDGDGEADAAAEEVEVEEGGERSTTTLGSASGSGSVSFGGSTGTGSGSCGGNVRVMRDGGGFV
ncbi:hypothetical protein F5X96DRAFT_668300 [Biscogniauxia mediterranea]|nr:hypothetical protein F5X96DRAFT_668300 [Biscogniauxia mediterranea]